MRNLAKDERIRKRIIKSIAPSIYGYKDITSAIAHPAFEQATEEVDVTPTLDADCINYACENVPPKLYDVGRGKLARLFTDLRREWLPTGSFPITLRHLESMIRMAEASAKMALREYVRADDISRRPSSPRPNPSGRPRSCTVLPAPSCETVSMHDAK
ncbi:MCM-domain-containing protein [Schizophyllum commune Tattone D]|nr:MCM-domain-containing protein [Schizophyllum commune Tattone D]